MQASTMKRSVLIFVATLPVAIGAWAANQSPNEMVEEAVELVAAKLDGNREALATDKAALYALIDEILLPRFDRNAAARAVLGKHRSEATEEQIKRFTEAFYVTLVHRYSVGLLEFGSDQVQFLEFRGDVAAKMATVKTIVRLEDGTKVPVNYVLSNKNPGWMMLDVSIEGISYVRNFRTEMDTEIRSKGLAAVIERLETDAGITAGE